MILTSGKEVVSVTSHIKSIETCWHLDGPGTADGSPMILSLTLNPAASSEFVVVDEIVAAESHELP